MNDRSPSYSVRELSTLSRSSSQRPQVCVYLESPKMLARTGIHSAVRHHQKSLELVEIPYTTDPSSDYEILHLHWIGIRSLRSLLRARSKDIKVVIHAHSTDRTTQGSITASSVFAQIGKRYMNFFYRSVDHIVAPSLYTRDLLKSYGIKTPISVISNGVDRSRFQFCPEKREKFREQFGLKKFTIFGVGQVIPRKGIIDFIEVARALPEFDFVWYGHRLPDWMSYHPDLLRAIDHRPANVHFLGFIEDSAGAFSAGDVLFFSSYEENQPVTLLEVASLGLPAIVREIPAYAGWLHHHVNCLKGKTVDDFVAQLKQLAQDSAFCARLGQKAQELAEAHRLERVGADYKDFYTSLRGTLPG